MVIQTNTGVRLINTRMRGYYPMEKDPGGEKRGSSRRGKGGVVR